MSTLKTALAAATLSLTVASTQVLAETQTRTIEYQVGDETFTVSVARADTGVTVATFPGALLYIRSASEPEYVPGSTTVTVHPTQPHR